MYYRCMLPIIATCCLFISMCCIFNELFITACCLFIAACCLFIALLIFWRLSLPNKNNGVRARLEPRKRFDEGFGIPNVVAPRVQDACPERVDVKMSDELQDRLSDFQNKVEEHKNYANEAGELHQAVVPKHGKRRWNNF